MFCIDSYWPLGLPFVPMFGLAPGILHLILLFPIAFENKRSSFILVKTVHPLFLLSLYQLHLLMKPSFQIFVLRPVLENVASFYLCRLIALVSPIPLQDEIHNLPLFLTFNVSLEVTGNSFPRSVSSLFAPNCNPARTKALLMWYVYFSLGKKINGLSEKALSFPG